MKQTVKQMPAGGSTCFRICFTLCYPSHQHRNDQEADEAGEAHTRQNPSKQPVFSSPRGRSHLLHSILTVV